MSKRLTNGLSTAVALALCCTAVYTSSANPIDPYKGKQAPADIPHTMNGPLLIGLKKLVEQQALASLIDAKLLGLAVVDLANNKNPRYAGMNDTLTMYAASLPKLAILLGLFTRVDRGTLVFDEKLRRQACEMIRESSNEEATELYYMVGPTFIRDLLTSPQLLLYDPLNDGGLWIGKEYGTHSALFRDPLYDLSHAASPWQVARFFYLLENGSLVSAQSTRQMKEILSETLLDHQFANALIVRYPKVILYRKSGRWRDYKSDAAIVYNGRKKYIVTALINHSDGEKILEQLVLGIDELMDESTESDFTHEYDYNHTKKLSVKQR